MSNTPAQRVLIVEDDQEIRDTLTEIVREAGHAVDCAANGLEALTVLRSGTPPPSVILLDLTMPVMDGFEFCNQKNADASIRDIPVVIMSAANQLDSKLPKTSVQGFLKKPMTLEVVLDTIERCCGIVQPA